MKSSEGKTESDLEHEIERARALVSASPSRFFLRSVGSPSSRSAGLATLIVGATTSLVVTVAIAHRMPALIATGDWRIICGAIAALALVGAPSSSIPLVRDIVGRFLPGGTSVRRDDPK